MSGPSTQIVYVGTYERDYPRNALVIAALRAAGCDVREIHMPVWERVPDKSGGFLRPASLFRLALRLLWSYLSLFAQVVRALPGADALAIGYIGQLDMLLLAPLAKLYRRPVVFNLLVTLTDTLIEDRGLVSAQSFAGRIVRLVDRLSLRLADNLLVDTAENGRYIQLQFGVPAERLLVVPVGADERYFHLTQAKTSSTEQIIQTTGRGGTCALPTSIRAQLVLREGTGPSPTENDGLCTQDISVLFYGKMIPLHGVETVLQAAKLLEHDCRFQFTIIGQGQLSAQVHSLATELELQNVTFIPWVAYERLSETITSADIVLGIFGDTEKAGRVVPNKVFQALACGAAVVTRDSTAIRSVLTDRESARLVPPADPAKLAGALKELADPAERQQLGEQARLAFERTGSQAALAAALRPLLESIGQRQAASMANRTARP